MFGRSIRCHYNFRLLISVNTSLHVLPPAIVVIPRS